METTTTTSTYALLASKAENLQQQWRDEEAIQLIWGLDWFVRTIACPNHGWTWPRSLDGESIEGFDAHQTCFKCTAERFFDTRHWQAGPMYRREGIRRSESAPRSHTRRERHSSRRFQVTLESQRNPKFNLDM